MAITLPGRDKVVATDTISGENFQRVKAAIGGVGEASDLDYGQATMANSLPVVIASNQSALTVGGAAADDAAASGNPVPIGGVYQATADVVDDGDVGRLRMTARRALRTAADVSSEIVEYDALPANGDPLSIFLSLTGQYASAQIVVLNTLDVTATINIYKGGTPSSVVATQACAPGSDYFLGIGAKQSGLSNNYIQVDALQWITVGTSVYVTFSGAPTSGKLYVSAYYR